VEGGEVEAPQPRTSILALDQGERRAVVNKAVNFLLTNPGAGERQCRRVLTNFAHVCQKRATKDVL